MYKLVYLQKAIDDLEELHLYISNDNEIAADKMVNAILDSIEKLKYFPFIGSAVGDRLDIQGDYRMITVRPYLAFYRVIKSDVVIYRVLHGRRYHSALLD